MIADFHSHILPGMDDGSGDIPESLKMLRMEAEQGIGTVIATPHFYARYDTPETFLENRAEAERKLREAMASVPDLPEIRMGAEVHYFPGMSESEFLPLLTIENSDYLLLELPMSPWPDSMYREMAAIYERQGIIPIIAHVDRYIAPFRTHGIPRRLAELPVLVQANAGFFLNCSTAAMALRLLKNEKIHLLGSDCHNLADRPPKLGAAVKKIRQKLPEDVLSWIAEYQNRVLICP